MPSMSAFLRFPPVNCGVSVGGVRSPRSSFLCRSGLTNVRLPGVEPDSKQV